MNRCQLCGRPARPRGTKCERCARAGQRQARKARQAADLALERQSRAEGLKAFSEYLGLSHFEFLEFLARLLDEKKFLSATGLKMFSDTSVVVEDLETDQ